MEGDSVEEAKVRVSELEHVRNFINLLIDARLEEWKEAKIKIREAGKK